MSPRLNALYPHSTEMGYGRMAIKIIDAMKRAGVEVFDDLPNGATEDVGQKFIPHGANSAICGHVTWLATPGHARGYWDGQHKSIMTMWEASILPEPFRESLDQFDTILVPSLHNLELISQYHPNVKFVPLGVDPSDWSPIDRPTMNEPFFTFLTSGGGTRKGSDLCIEAFRKVFDGKSFDGPIPRLIVQARKVDQRPTDSNIHLVSGTLTDEEERAMYGMAHCYIQASRGEGFGLRPLQAIAQGCPTIATDAHGHAAFSHLMTYPIPAQLVQTPPNSFHHGPAGSWWEPDFESLCAAMEDVYDNYDASVKRARSLGFQAIGELNWDVCAERYLEAIGLEELELPDIKPTKWIVPDMRRYLVRVTSPRFFEVGGTQYLLEPNRDYWEPADVKRVLFESGCLDLSCLPQNLDHDTDIGLTDDQIDRLDAGYSGHLALCPTCGNKLNTNRPTLEELEALPMPIER